MTTTVNNRFRASHSVYNSWQRSAERRRSCLVYNSCGLMPSQTWSRINICTHFVFETRIYLPAESGEDLNAATECSDANFLMVLRNNYMGLSCLVFEIWSWNGRQTDDGNHIVYLGGPVRFHGWRLQTGSPSIAEVDSKYSTGDGEGQGAYRPTHWTATVRYSSLRATSPLVIACLVNSDTSGTHQRRRAGQRLSVTGVST